MLCGMMAGCQTMTPSSEIDSFAAARPGADFCQVARAIYYSRKDTTETIVQVREHNAVGVALRCGWRGKNAK